MACFVVPAAEAVITTTVTKILERRECKQKSTDETENVKDGKIPFSRKLGWLNKILWGGSGLLAFEHVWHGEVVPYFPFLTNAANPENATEMLHEMATAGVSMAVLVTFAWVGMLLVVSVLEKRETCAVTSIKEEESV